METLSLTNRWPSQIRTFNEVLKARAEGVKALCIAGPTGSGKTRSMVDVIEHFDGNHEPTAMYCQRKMLYEQTCRILDAEGISYGKRASGHEVAYLRDIQICMAPTELSQLKRQARELHKSSIVLVDEAHQGGGEGFQSLLQQHIGDDSMVVGFTATPLDLPPLYERLCVVGQPSEMRQVGALVPAITYAPDEPDLRKIRKYQVGEDLSEADNVKAIMRHGVFGRVLDAWRRHNPQGHASILFAPGVGESLWFAEQFTKAGIRAAHIDGTDTWLDGEFHGNDQEIRDRIGELSAAGEIKIVCNRFVLREGINWPWLRCASMATVFGSLTAYLQSGGRLLRASPGKKSATIIDHGGNWHRHGSLNSDREWTLGMTNKQVCAERQERMKQKKEGEPIVCPQCGKVRAGGKECSACGFVAHRNTRIVVQIDGTLRRVEGDIYKPHKVRGISDQEKKWQQAYYRAKNSKNGMTFKQAEALYYREHNAWPPHDLPMMPKDEADWSRKVSAVPYSELIERPKNDDPQRRFA